MPIPYTGQVCWLHLVFIGTLAYLCHLQQEACDAAEPIRQGGGMSLLVSASYLHPVGLAQGLMHGCPGRLRLGSAPALGSILPVPAHRVFRLRMEREDDGVHQTEA